MWLIHGSDTASSSKQELETKHRNSASHVNLLTAIDVNESQCLTFRYTNLTIVLHFLFLLRERTYHEYLDLRISKPGQDKITMWTIRGKKLKFQRKTRRIRSKCPAIFDPGIYRHNEPEIFSSCLRLKLKCIVIMLSWFYFDRKHLQVSGELRFN